MDRREQQEGGTDGQTDGRFKKSGQQSEKQEGKCGQEGGGRDGGCPMMNAASISDGQRGDHTEQSASAGKACA